MSTDCRRTRTALQLYLDGRLDHRRLAGLETHLRGCAACREELIALETLRDSLADLRMIEEPANLTTLILTRVASYEAGMRAKAEAVALARAQRQFGPRWGDAVLAAGLATLSTVLFVLLDPQLREAAPLAAARAFPNVVSLLSARGPGSIAWVAWVVWIATGLLLTLWLAGAEVRASWRRSLSDRLAQLPLPRGA